MPNAEKQRLYKMEFGSDVQDLHIASSQGQISRVDELLSKNVDVDCVTNLGWTPLMCAARNGRLNVIHKLIDYGANVLHVNKLGVSVLSMAAASGNKQIVEILLKWMQEKQILPIKEHLTYPFLVAILLGHIHVMKLFLDTDEELLNNSNEYGLSSLMIAAVGNQVEILKYLLNCGADPNKRNIFLNTALNIATIKKHQEIENILKEKKQISDLYFSPDTDSIGRDLVENYGWSLNTSNFNKNVKESTQETISQAFRSSTNLRISTTTATSTTSAALCPSNSDYSSNKNFSPYSQVQLKSSAENECHTPIIPVPPLSPYFNSSPFVFPNKQWASEHTSFKKNGDGDIISYSFSLIPNKECMNSDVECKNERCNGFDVPYCATPRVKYNKQTSLGKKEKIKLWWNQRMTERLKNLMSSKQKKSSESNTEKKKEPLHSLNPCIAEKSMCHLKPECSENVSKKMPGIIESSVLTLLQSLKLDMYISLFEQHEIDMESFMMLDETDLQEMGIVCSTSKKKLLKTIASFKENI